MRQRRRTTEIGQERGDQLDPLIPWTSPSTSLRLRTDDMAPTLPVETLEAIIAFAIEACENPVERQELVFIRLSLVSQIIKAITTQRKQDRLAVGSRQHLNRLLEEDDELPARLSHVEHLYVRFGNKEDHRELVVNHEKEFSADIGMTLGLSMDARPFRSLCHYLDRQKLKSLCIDLIRQPILSLELLVHSIQADAAPPLGNGAPFEALRELRFAADTDFAMAGHLYTPSSLFALAPNLVILDLTGVAKLGHSIAFERPRTLREVRARRIVYNTACMLFRQTTDANDEPMPMLDNVIATHILYTPLTAWPYAPWAIRRLQLASLGFPPGGLHIFAKDGRMFHAYSNVEILIVTSPTSFALPEASAFFALCDHLKRCRLRLELRDCSSYEDLWDAFRSTPKLERLELELEESVFDKFVAAQDCVKNQMAEKGVSIKCTPYSVPPAQEAAERRRGSLAAH